MSEPDLFKTLGAHPDLYAHHFARRFAVINALGEFVNADEVLREWFNQLAHAVREDERSHQQGWQPSESERIVLRTRERDRERNRGK